MILDQVNMKSISTLLFFEDLIMKHTMLKIKLKTLAEEARIIRHQERKMGGVNWGGHGNVFRQHRIDVVRFEARATHIAYGFLRGRTYKQIESKCHDIGDHFDKILWNKVKAMVKKYGSLEDSEHVDKWRKGSKLTYLNRFMSKIAA